MGWGFMGSDNDDSDDKDFRLDWKRGKHAGGTETISAKDRKDAEQQARKRAKDVGANEWNVTEGRR